MFPSIAYADELSRGNPIRGYIVLLILLVVYLLPGIIAYKRKHHNASAIMSLNIILGWTVLGWVGALVWACTNPSPANQQAVPLPPPPVALPYKSDAARKMTPQPKADLEKPA